MASVSSKCLTPSTARCRAELRNDAAAEDPFRAGDPCKPVWSGGEEAWADDEVSDEGKRCENQVDMRPPMPA